MSINKKFNINHLYLFTKISHYFSFFSLRIFFVVKHKLGDINDYICISANTVCLELINLTNDHYYKKFIGHGMF